MNPESPTPPSRLQLDRYATGELSPEAAAELEAGLDDRARSHLAALEATKAEVPPVDVAALRARARALPDAAGAPEVMAVTPANRSLGAWIGALGLLVAAATVALFVLPDAPPSEGHYAVRGGALVLHLARDGALERYVAGTPVGDGDVFGFEVSEEGHRSVVVLSVDGAGAVSVFYPAEGPEPIPLDGQGRRRLEGTVVLDGAPGPEVFLARFDRPVYDVVDEVTAVFEDGGHPGLLRWAGQTEAVSAVEITRR